MAEQVALKQADTCVGLCTGHMQWNRLSAEVAAGPGGGGFDGMLITTPTSVCCEPSPHTDTVCLMQALEVTEPGQCTC